MRKTLEKYFGYTDFYPLQEDIISNVLDCHDVLALMPTGAGKSLCYQLPAVMKEGVTVVISPLIALMKDQVDDLRSMGIPAASINSTLDYNQSSEIKSQLIKKEIRLLYAAPERIMIPDFFTFLQQLNISLIAVDEAHCISEWGHDFRPEYRKLNLLKTNFPGVPLIALTSTAIPQVQNDIVNQLNMAAPKIYRSSLDRKNLFYQIRPKKEMYQYLLSYIKNRPKDSGIVYCQSRKSVEKFADKLQRDGIRALPYHAGLSSDTRTENQEKFIKDDVEVIVATIAFGMGIDKPNIRYVFHCDMPKSIEGYYQETGRAGRDGLNSDCILFFSYSDKIKHEYFIRQIEDKQYRQIAYKKMRDMINFCESKKCRRTDLLNYFGQKYNQHNCDMCDVCAPRNITKFALRQTPEPKSLKPLKTTSFSYQECDQKLFEILRNLRKVIADREKMPPYIIFSDVTLKEMSKRYPQDLLSLRGITGVGEVKLEKYGRLFLEKIKDYCKENNIKLKTELAGQKAYSVVELKKQHPTAYAKWTNEEEQRLISEYNNGRTINELSKLLGRQPGGIRSRLRKLNVIL
ncbi:MAG: RecQ family ATP-dependent DNA helicase [Candidatus Omnitrophica bacterium]|nr:RecQ family ATP-dependent DNA helicase [Candidatus Omnitrophota bacterium]